jgi:galactan endo-1,6-beta-galactosidase
MVLKLILTVTACLMLIDAPRAAKASGSAAAPPHAEADHTATVNPVENWGTWERWGCSLSWWAKLFGDRDDFADMLFIAKSTTFHGRSLPGLALNVVRYQAGAWGQQTIAGVAMAASPHMQSRAKIEGYWLDGKSTDPESKSWDWSVDANQRAMLLKAKDRGANMF